MALANKIQDAFENVKADPTLKQSTMQFLQEKRRKKWSLFPGSARRVLAIVYTIAVFLFGAGGYAWLFMPVSYVSIDINPSVELALNRLDRVVFVTAYNTQGDALLKDLRLKGKNYIQAIDIIANSVQMLQYLNADEELVLTVAADSSKTALRTGVESCCRHIGHGTRSVSVDVDTAAKAHDNGLSVGKYSAYLKLVQYDASVTIEQCKNMSMSQIHSQILEHEHGSGSAHESGHGHGSCGNTDEAGAAQTEQDAGTQPSDSETDIGQPSDPAADQQPTDSETDIGQPSDPAADQQSSDLETDIGQPSDPETDQPQDAEQQGHQHRRRQGHHGSHE